MKETAMPRVTLALPWTDEAGKSHKPDSTHDLDNATAAQLIADGWARPADKKES